MINFALVEELNARSAELEHSHPNISALLGRAVYALVTETEDQPMSSDRMVVEALSAKYTNNLPDALDMFNRVVKNLESNGVESVQAINTHPVCRLFAEQVYTTASQMNHTVATEICKYLAKPLQDRMIRWEDVNGKSWEAVLYFDGRVLFRGPNYDGAVITEASFFATKPWMFPGDLQMFVERVVITRPLESELFPED